MKFNISPLNVEGWAMPTQVVNIYRLKDETRPMDPVRNPPVPGPIIVMTKPAFFQALTSDDVELYGECGVPLFAGGKPDAADILAPLTAHGSGLRLTGELAQGSMCNGFNFDGSPRFFFARANNTSTHF